MKFIYATDLHGDQHKYGAVLDYATRLGIKVIHLGADLLPKGPGILKIQKNFVKGFLADFYEEAKNKGITVLAFFGNDDIYTRKQYFRKFGSLLDENLFETEGYTFTAYGYVPDYMFGLKTACKLDYPGWWCPEDYIHDPSDVGGEGFYGIEDIQKYFLEKGTIEEDLRTFPGGDSIIAAIHTPPFDSGLDVVPRGDGKYLNVGSRAVRKWIETAQPRMVLSGHIHEAPSISGLWKCQIGKTLVLQPGQKDRGAVLVAVDVQPETIELERFVVPA